MKRILTIAALLLSAASALAAPMKARVIQPLFAQDRPGLDKSFEWTIKALDKCKPGLDIIVLPEFSEVPGATPDPADFLKIAREYGPVLLKACSETARRCKALVFVGCIDTGCEVPRNATFVYDREGNLIGKYYKENLTAGEWKKYGLDKSTNMEWTKPLMMDIEGVRYAFLTCYDFYFYENYSNIARWKPDVIIGCSHQRSDPFRALDIINSFCAYNTGAYLVRASVSMGRRSKLGGCSCVVAPSGRILGNLRSRVRWMDVTFDPKEKYLKPAGYGNPPAMHSEYIEIGRRPWKYRPGGSAICPPLAEMPQERSRFSSNDIGELGAAVARGVQEISFDLDPAGDWEGKLEGILRKLSCHAIMDIHVNGRDWDDDALKRLYGLVFDFDAVGHTVFTAEDEGVRARLAALAPGIPCR